jgi:hypothetical protein
MTPPQEDFMQSMSSRMDPPFAIKNRDSHLARCLEIALGAWMVTTPVLFNLTVEQTTSNFIVGAILVAAGLVGLFVWPAARFVSGLAGAWMIISAFVLPSISDSSIWTSVIFGICALGLATVPNYGSVRVLDRMHLHRHATV